MKKKNNNYQPIDKTELVWPGKRKEVERVELPFQTVEVINAPRGGRQEVLGGVDTEWRNRLIWGDNLLIMGSLLKEYAGKINLIYIDPPFATGDDFSFEVQIGDQEITKEPSALEVKAYRDTWGKGMQSYLQMMYDRLVLMKELLTDTGSIYVHCDYRLNSYLRLVLDDIFRKENFRNEIVWRRAYSHNDGNKFGIITDTIFWYSKTENYIYNKIFLSRTNDETLKEYPYIDEKTGKRYKSVSMNAAGSGEPRYFGGKGLLNSPKGTHWRWSQKRIDQALKDDVIFFTANSVPRYKQFAENIEGKQVQNLWMDFMAISSQANELLDYPTQKPEALAERIIKASSNSGDLIADFFCGSGTTGEAAEKLNRRWVMSDLGRFAIHTARKRLLSFEVKDKKGNIIKKAKPFVVQNLGKYERHRWVKLNGLYKNYITFILELYHAEPVEGFTNLHGKKDKAFVRVGAVDAPVTLSEIRETLSECKENKIKALAVLGWEWEMGLHDLVKEEAERYGVKLSTLQIPREVMELNVSGPKVKEDIHFYELAYLEVKPKTKGKRVTITLKDFIIPNPELLPEEVKGKVKNWNDFIDYWAVDWDFNGDSFHNMNQRYRTRKEPKLELSMDYIYPKTGKYNILVKVIDIFGNDTTKLIEVKV